MAVWPLGWDRSAFRQLHPRQSSPIQDPLFSPHNKMCPKTRLFQSIYAGNYDICNVGRTNTDGQPKSDRPEHRCAINARELARYDIDIAALSKTCFPEEGTMSSEEG